MRTSEERDDFKREVDLSEWLKASAYFLPHVLFRLAALSITFAFLGYYSIAFVALVVLVIFFLAMPVILKEKKDRRVNSLLSLFLTLFAPIAFQSSDPSNRHLMKRTITVITFSLLIVLTLIRIVPLLVHPDTLVATYGLCHLNFHQPSGLTFNIYSLLEV